MVVFACSQRSVGDLSVTAHCRIYDRFVTSLERPATSQRPLVDILVACEWSEACSRLFYELSYPFSFLYHTQVAEVTGQLRVYDK